MGKRERKGSGSGGRWGVVRWWVLESGAIWASKEGWQVPWIGGGTAIDNTYYLEKQLESSSELAFCCVDSVYCGCQL